MGGEFGQWREWAMTAVLDWDLLDYPLHAGLQNGWRTSIAFTAASPRYMNSIASRGGFEWIDCDDAESSMVSLIRKGKSSSTVILVVCNFTPVPRYSYRIGSPHGGCWREVLNSDATEYGGSSMGNRGGVETVPGRSMAAHIPSRSHCRPYRYLFLRTTYKKNRRTSEV